MLIKNRSRSSEYLPEDIPLPEGPLYREIGIGDQKELVLIKGMVHLIYKLLLKTVLLCVKWNYKISFHQQCLFLCKVGLKLQKISVRS